MRITVLLGAFCLSLILALSLTSASCNTAVKPMEEADKTAPAIELTEVESEAATEPAIEEPSIEVPSTAAPAAAPVAPDSGDVDKILAESLADPSNISSAEKDMVMNDVNIFVTKMNTIISKQDYATWVNYLTPLWRAQLASPSFLNRSSKSERLLRFNIKLKTLYDYFIHVTYPSRKNVHIDDIDFASDGKVKAYMINGGQRYRVYELQRDGDSWKICG